MITKLSAEQEVLLCQRYKNGESTLQLAPAFGISSRTVSSVLKRNGVVARSAKEARGGLTAAQEAEVCRRYLEGESTPKLAKVFDVSARTISAILKRNSVATRAGKLSPTQKAEIVRRYLDGEGSVHIARSLGITPTGVIYCLECNNVAIRTIKEARGGLSDAQELEVCSRYLVGENTVQLGAEFGVSSATISKILKRSGVEVRARDGRGDSVQCVLDGAPLYAQPRECAFYVVELARYSSTHSKPGISFDSVGRASRSYGQYGDEALRLIFATRAEAFFLEQAVLDATRCYQDCPDDLWRWDGASEVRAMPSQDLAAIAIRLAAELEEMGAWAFAAAHVPMTAHQRILCQQRALTCNPIHPADLKNT
jgi:DNA-directed RNA polymerase specialized sigma24 family protein